MREVVFDTETTGLDAAAGERIVEIGCVELVNLLPTGRELQAYIDPGRLMSEGAERVTGITNDMLAGKPSFGDPSIVDALLAFFGDSPIVAHNADFDRGFLNAELTRLGRPTIAKERFIDTVALAREHRPGAPASLDAVCKRFNISLEGRELHGALKDARLLAAVYLELRGGRERRFEFASATRAASRKTTRKLLPQRPQPLPAEISDAEAAAHAAFVEKLGPAAVWKRYS